MNSHISHTITRHLKVLRTTLVTEWKKLKTSWLNVLGLCHIIKVSMQQKYIVLPLCCLQRWQRRSFHKSLGLSEKCVCRKTWKPPEFKVFISDVRWIHESRHHLEWVVEVGLWCLSLEAPPLFISSVIHRIFCGFKIGSELGIGFNCEDYWFLRIKECQAIDKPGTNYLCHKTARGNKLPQSLSVNTSLGHQGATQCNMEQSGQKSSFCLDRPADRRDRQDL